MKYIVEIENLVKRYGDLVALDHFNLKIEEGEIFGLLGPNGSGKTTAIHSMLSLLEFDKGTIKLFGKDMTPQSYDIKADIGVVLQNVAVFEELTVYDNVDYFCSLYVRDKKKRKEYVEEAISFVGLEDFKKFYPKKLSGGLLRRLNIACGISHKPKFIIMDEPTVAIDPQSRNKILEGIKELNKNGATILYTSHYMEEVEQICTRIGIIDKGRNIAIGTNDELKKMIDVGEEIQIESKEMSKEDIVELRTLENVKHVDYVDNQLKISCLSGKDNLLNILDFMRKKELEICNVYSKLPTLNDVFLEMTGKELRD